MGDRESITFYNSKTKQAIIYDRNIKEFITGQKLRGKQPDKYEQTGNIWTKKP